MECKSPMVNGTNQWNARVRWLMGLTNNHQESDRAWDSTFIIRMNLYLWKGIKGINFPVDQNYFVFNES
jgi:hypothetical protein